MFLLSNFPNGMRRLLSIRSGHCQPGLVSSSYFLLVLWILIHMDPHSFGCPGSGSVLGMRDPDPGAWKFKYFIHVKIQLFVTQKGPDPPGSALDPDQDPH
jgi:hypothetical protein